MKVEFEKTYNDPKTKARLGKIRFNGIKAINFTYVHVLC